MKVMLKIESSHQANNQRTIKSSMSGTTTNNAEAYAKDLQDAQENFVQRHHELNAAETCISLLKSQNATLTLAKVEAKIPELEAALREAEEELESANITYSYKRFAPPTAPQAAAATTATTTTAVPIFTTQRSEFGMYKFTDPCRQATYAYHEDAYMKMLKLKNSYDKQELLRRMRTDIKREYLTRKKQVTRLQKDAAIDFRNAESSLQEHYATEAADHQPYIRGVDINAPLVSQIQLPNGKHFDLKTFDEHHEFARVRQIHEDLRRDQERDQEQEQGQKRDQEQGQEEEQRWCEAEKEVWNNWVKRQYLQRSPYETRRVKEIRNEVQENTEGDMPQLCLEESRHDSDYCGPFGYYPRGEVPRERHEAGLASIRRRAQAEQQQEEEEEEQVGRYGDGGFCGCGDLECSDCFSYGNENDDQSSYNSEYDYPREYNYERECREAEEAEEAAAQAQAAEQQVMDNDTSYRCDDYPDVVTLTEPKERITVAAAGGTISAKTKAKSKTKAAAAAKARIAKKQQNKFAPITVTINTNRVSVEDAESSSTMLYKGKVQINLPKKNMQASSASASREDKKRHDEKWRRINAAQKQSNARGTRIANIPEPKAWWNCGDSDCE
jgi:hypothetical protein